jgi:hypothetical protein
MNQLSTLSDRIGYYSLISFKFSMLKKNLIEKIRKCAKKSLWYTYRLQGGNGTPLAQWLCLLLMRRDSKEDRSASRNADPVGGAGYLPAAVAHSPRVTGWPVPLGQPMLPEFLPERERWITLCWPREYI